MTEFYILAAITVLLAAGCVALFMRQGKIQENLASLQQAKDALQGENQALEGLRIQYESYWQHAQSQLQNAQQTQTELKQNLQTEQSTNTALREEIAELKGVLGAVQSQVGSLNGELSTRQQALNELQQAHTAALQKNTELQTALQEKTERFAAQEQHFQESKQQLKLEFQNLANQIFEDKSKQFKETNQGAVQSLLQPFREQLDQFQARVNHLHGESSKENATLQQEIKHMLAMGVKMNEEASQLSDALRGNKKVLGNWGEMQLEQALQSVGLEPNTHYRAQQHFKDEKNASNYPDFIINVPEGKQIIIDSKMSLNAYQNAVNAEDETTAKTALASHCQALRNHIKSLSEKNYSALAGLDTPNFVLMFIPLEPAFMEALRYDPSLFDYGYQRNVIMVSHTTLMPVIQTVANLWRLVRTNEEAKDISKKAGDIFNQFCTMSERLAKLGTQMTTASKTYNDVVTAFCGQQGVYQKVRALQDFSNSANKQLPDLKAISTQPEFERLPQTELNNLDKPDSYRTIKI